MNREFVAKHGLIVRGNTHVTGSLTVTDTLFGPHTGSTYGTASYAKHALTASCAQRATSASYALQALSSSHSSYSNDSDKLDGQHGSYYQKSLNTGSTYPFTSSWANKAIAAFTASYADSFTVKNDLTVGGILRAGQISSSLIYITASHITVTDNILELNAQTPHMRYAGIEMYDSGSTDQMASILWDGQNNYFFISSSDAGYSRKIVLGPTLEKDLTIGKIPVVTSGDSIGDSIIQQIGSVIYISGSLSATSVTASLYGTASWANHAISASHTLKANSARSSSYALQTRTASYTHLAHSSSYALQTRTASYSNYSSDSDKLDGQHGSYYQKALRTGSTYPFTSSWTNRAISSSQALKADSARSSSYALQTRSSSYSNYSSDSDKLDGQHGSYYQKALNTGSTYPFTSSWANRTISSSHTLKADSARSSSYALVARSSSHALKADSARSSSYALQARTASYSNYSSDSDKLDGQHGVYYQKALRTGSTYPFTSSWANRAISSSQALKADSARSSSYALQARSSSYANNATQARSASYATLASTASYALIARSSSHALKADSARSSSYALQARTSSYAAKSYWNILTKDPTGFPNITDTTLSYNSSSHKVMISGSNWKVYCNGNEYIKNNEAIVITPVVKAQTYYISYTTTGVLQQSAIPWDFISGNASVATVFIGAGAGNGFLSDERHGILMDGSTHEYLHETVGPRYASGYTWTTVNAATGTYTLTAGEWYDDDFDHRDLMVQSSSLIAYYNQGMVVSTTENTSVYGGGVERYNNTTLGTLVNLTGGQAGCFFVYAINGVSNKLISVYGQRVDTSVANARTNNTADKLIFGNFPFTEAKLLYRVIVTTAGISEVTDYRTAQYAGSTFVATSHGSLTGLTNDDHPQYLLLAGRTGQTAAIFSGSIVGSSSYATHARSSSYALQARTASYALLARSSSHALKADSARSSSYALQTRTSSYSNYSSDSDKLDGQHGVYYQKALRTGSTYPFTSSWANRAISSSHALKADSARSSSYALQARTASYALVGRSSSYALQARTASYSNYSSDSDKLDGQHGSYYQKSLRTGSTYPFTSSWANRAISSSQALKADSARSSSYALQARTASYALQARTASYALIARSSSYALIARSSSYALQANSARSSSYPWVTAAGNISYVGGNVGIGTTTPGTKLHVQGAISGSSVSVTGNITTNTMTVTGLLRATQISGSQVYITSSQLVVTDNIIKVNASTPHLRYAGIEMYDSGSTSNVASFLWDGTNNYFFLSSSDAGYSRKIVTGPDSKGNLTANYIPLAIANNGLNNSVMFQSSNNIGIGTTSPGRTLEVVGQVAASGAAGSLDIYQRGAHTNAYGLYSPGTANDLRFYNYQTSADIMTLLNNGNVGIGTTTPWAKLHINGSVINGNTCTATGAYSHAEGNNTTTNGHYSHAEGYATTATGDSSHAGGNNTVAYASYQTVVGQFNIANNSTDLFVVGGGSSDGARKDILKVSTTGLVISGSVGVTGVVTCLSLTETSTLAMKEDIEPLTDQLMNILKLNPVSFTYKNTQEASIGLIAEEVAEIYPEFTSKNHDAISYGKIVSVLIKGIKELKEIVDNQQKQINRLLG